MSRALREQAGRRAEAVAAWWLRLKGFTVLARRHRAPGGEIDLVVRRGRLLVFVEVKQRADLDLAAAAVTPHQQRRIAQAAEHYRAVAPKELRALDVRFDVVLVAPGRPPRHVADAFRPAAGDLRG